MLCDSLVLALVQVYRAGSLIFTTFKRDDVSLFRYVEQEQSEEMKNRT